MTDTDSSGRVSNTSEPTDHTGMRVLTLQDCLARLGSAPVGRVAFALDGEIAGFSVSGERLGIEPFDRGMLQLIATYAFGHLLLLNGQGAAAPVRLNV